MTRRNRNTEIVAEAVYEWLLDRQADDIPRCAEIGALVAPQLPWKPDGYRVYQALKWLEAHRMILLRTSTAHQTTRGQIALRLTQHDRAFKTPLCTFAPPDLAATATG